MSNRLLPNLLGLRGYSSSWWRGDVQAGLSVAAYLIPQALAYAALAGLSPIVGLWTALPPLVLYAVLGSSRQLSVGPESTTALMTAAVLGPLALGDPSRYAHYAATLAVFVGVICLIAALLRLGFLSNLLSRPVLVGYLTGIAIVMIASQLGKMTGVATSGDTVVDQVMSVTVKARKFHWPTALFAVGVLALIVALSRWTPRLPGPLIGVLCAAAAVAVFGLGRHGIDVVGAVPTGLPPFEVPELTRQSLRDLLGPAFGIAVVAFSDNVLTARSFAARRSADIDADAELRALAVCNVAVGFTQGFPVSSSGSRTALGDASGSRTQVYSLVVFLVVICVVVVGGGFIAYIPSAALGALIFYAATKLVDVGEFRRLARFRRSEFVLAALTAVAVCGLGVLYGVIAAVLLSILDLLRRLARAHDSVQGLVPGLAGMHDVDDYPLATLIPGLIVYRYDAPLCFANAEDFRHRALAAVDHSPPPVNWFVLNAEANVEVDMTALDALERLREELAGRGIVFAMARVKQDLHDALDAAGMLDKIGSDRLYMTLPTAVEAYERAQAHDDPSAS
ncbi:SulP family inorganic anion transporter [Mycobacterium antarcticum]|uniref:SulP family inorganic anion transporter n=1 Tax=Mycolicibacterium sp. TUM20983 TaxID=3023369 RepID=UPI0024E0693F|nr:sulfate permease [Mycolicibacterium sp. TUM20983]